MNQVTKSQLRQIIKEEVTLALSEIVEEGEILQRLHGVLQRAASSPSPNGLKKGIALAIDMIRQETGRGAPVGGAGL